MEKLRWKTFGKLAREVAVEGGGLKMSHLGALGGSVSYTHLTSAQVMSLWFVDSSPVSDFALTVRSLLGILSAPPPLTLTLKLNKLKKKKVLLVSTIR